MADEMMSGDTPPPNFRNDDDRLEYIRYRENIIYGIEESEAAFFLRLLESRDAALREAQHQLDLRDEALREAREENANRELRRQEILDWLQDEIGTGWVCVHCNYSTYHAFAKECANCGADFPLLNMLAFKLHASHTDARPQPAALREAQHQLDLRDEALREAREENKRLLNSKAALRQTLSETNRYAYEARAECERLRVKLETATKIIAAEIGARPQPATHSSEIGDACNSASSLGGQVSNPGSACQDECLPSAPSPGFFHSLTPEQQAAALAYRGPDHLGSSAPSPVPPLQFTDEQLKYLHDLRAAETTYDPNTVIGGPSPPADTATDGGQPEAGVLAEIAAERKRQVEAEGWSRAHDDKHEDGSLALAAAYYAAPVEIRCPFVVPCGCRSAGECPHETFPKMKWRRAWPWAEPPKRKDRRRDLIRAAALIIAEIERIDRARASGIEVAEVGDDG